MKSRAPLEENMGKLGPAGVGNDCEDGAGGSMPSERWVGQTYDGV